MGHVIAISHCLLGCHCCYDGSTNTHDGVRELAERDDVAVVPVCPERASGLPVPRLPAERVGSRVLLADGTDVTEKFIKGAHYEAARAINARCDVAVLKAKSPSCGSGRIYDGTFGGRLTDGWGIMAEMLRDAGVRCVSENEIETLKSDSLSSKRRSECA